MEMLDRLVATRHWLEEYGNMEVEVLVSNSSNHCPLKFTIKEFAFHKQRQRIFRYEVKWALKEDGEQAILRVCQQIRLENNCWMQMSSKLLKCSRDLLKWSAQKKKIF